MADAADIAYRFEDRLCSVADEDGEHAYSRTEITLYKFEILRHTKCGMWIRDYGGAKRFINQTCTKQYAHEKVEDALQSFIARKEKQASIYRARADTAMHAIRVARSKYPAHYKAIYPTPKKEHEGPL